MERDLRDAFLAIGLTTARTAQRTGKTGVADLDGIDGVHIECKGVEKLNIDAAMNQAIRDAEGTGNVPIVCHRKKKKPKCSRGDWKVTVRLIDFLELCSRMNAARGD